MSAQPMYCWKHGDRLGTLVKGSTYWCGQLLRGDGPDEFESTLETIASFLTKNEHFITESKQEHGKVELILNHHVEFDEGKVFELYIHPRFLGLLATFGVGLRVQGWSGSRGP
jgi:hypothetical protein